MNENNIRSNERININNKIVVRHKIENRTMAFEDTFPPHRISKLVVATCM